MEKIVEELIEKVSLIYREQRNKANETKKEIFKLENELKDVDISHRRYTKIQDDLIYLKQKYQKN